MSKRYDIVAAVLAGIGYAMLCAVDPLVSGGVALVILSYAAHDIAERSKNE